MDTYTLAYAKEHLEELAARAAAGEEVRINDPELGLMTLTHAPGAAPHKRRLGHLKGVIAPPPDGLFAPLDDDQLKLWQGDAA